MKITQKTVETAYNQLIRELDGCQVTVNHIMSYDEFKSEDKCEHGIEIHLGIADYNKHPMVLKLHADTIRELAGNCEDEKQKTQDEIDTFSSDLECEMNIAIRTASAFKQYELGRISWWDFKSTALSLHNKSKINMDLGDNKNFVEFLESLRPRVYTTGSNSPYEALLDFDGIFSALSRTNEFEEVLDNVEYYDGFEIRNEVIDELYEKGSDEFVRKMYDAGLHLGGSRL